MSVFLEAPWLLLSIFGAALSLVGAYVQMKPAKASLMQAIGFLLLTGGFFLSAVVDLTSPRGSPPDGFFLLFTGMLFGLALGLLVMHTAPKPRSDPELGNTD